MVRELDSRGWTVHACDIAYGDADLMNALYWFRQDAGPTYDLVVHCAYHVGGRAAIDGRNMNFAKNLQLDAAMFEWAVRTRQRRVLYFSSSAAYNRHHQDKEWVEEMLERGRNVRLREAMVPLEPTEADANYGFAKCVGERLAEDARRSGLAVSVVRPFSGYGEDQALDYPFPSIISRAKAGDLSVWGPPGQTRDWIHVSDVIAGALAVVESGTADPVNLCTGRGVEMGELAVMAHLQKMSDYPEYVMCEHEHEPTYDESKPTGVFYRVGDPTRMLQYYEPKVTLEEGIQRALAAQAH